MLVWKPADRSRNVNTIKYGTHNTEHNMRLMTKELAAKFPPLRSTDGSGGEALVVAKYFTPDSSWSWYATEYDATDEHFFGWVDSGHDAEYGYFALAALPSARGPMGLPIESGVHLRDGFTIADAKKASVRR